MRGRLLLAGWRMADLSPPELLDAVFAIMADAVDGLVDRSEVLRLLTERMGTPIEALLAEAAAENADPDGPPVVNRDTWGTGPRAVAGQSAMMAMVGAPPMPAVPEEVTSHDDHR